MERVERISEREDQELPDFRVETVQAAIEAWAKEIPRRRLFVAYAMPPELGNQPPETMIRALVKGGKYKHIANVCGVSFDAFSDLLQGKTQTRGQQYTNICKALFFNGRLTRADSIPSVMPALSVRTVNFVEQLEHLGELVARWQPGKYSKNAVSSRSALDFQCDQLQEEAQLQGALEVSEGAVLLKGCLRIKAGVDAPSNGTRNILGALKYIHARSHHPGIGEGAAYVAARLLHAIIFLTCPRVEWPYWCAHASELMLRVTGKHPMPFRLPLPGLANEQNHENLYWPAGQDPMTAVITRPFRYQGMLLQDAGYHHYFCYGPDDLCCKTFIDAGVRCVQQGLGEQWTCEQPLLGLNSIALPLGTAEFLFKQRDNGLRMESRRDQRKTDQIIGSYEGFLSDIEGCSSLPLVRKGAMLSVAHTFRVVLLHDGERRCRALHDEVLPQLTAWGHAGSHAKATAPYESIFQHTFLRDPDLARPFLCAIGFTKQEINVNMPKLMVT